ncbi:hypothetical protein HaLaN_01355 [Haematococcus lacustris]|uniref:Uncharacterized protein n=1 Tax=Haematococcus lacustris TaxID=44745 RepID=A0A699YBI5_HAELA|nr:hypothetical protein HaLaN_01355 [Haematococcus lacustris]
MRLWKGTVSWLVLQWHWPRSSLFNTVFDPLHAILSPLGSTSHNGVVSRRGGLVAGGISVPSSLCCRRTGNSRLLPRQARGVPGCFENQHQTHTSPRVSQAAVQQGNQPLKTVSCRMPIVNHPHLHHRARQQRGRAAANKEVARSQQGMTWSKTVSGRPLDMSGRQCPA